MFLRREIDHEVRSLHPREQRQLNGLNMTNGQRSILTCRLVERNDLWELPAALQCDPLPHYANCVDRIDQGFNIRLEQIALRELEHVFSHFEYGLRIRSSRTSLASRPPADNLPATTTILGLHPRHSGSLHR